MANSNGRISVPIEIDDPATVVWVKLTRTVNGVVQEMYSYDVGTLCGSKVGDIISALDSDGNWTVADREEINKWARFKPVRVAQDAEITHAQRKTVNFGLAVPFVVNGGALLNDAVYSILQAPSYADVGWGYSKPAGGANTPYRLTDFVAKANDATTAPWVSSASGYNHNAPFPCTVSIMSGVAAMGDNTYEVNLQTTQTLTFYFENALGQDLCIQDFLDWTLNSGTYKWRPVLQMFYPSGTTPWYQVTTPSATAGGTEIDYTRTTSLTVSLSTTGWVQNQIYHVCLGIGCCDASASSYPTSNVRLFIAPFDRSTRFIPQFYYKIRFVNYFSHKIKVLEVWYPTQYGYVQATNSGGSQSFIVANSILSGPLGVKMEIERTNLEVYFVKMNTTDTHTPKMYIQAGEQIGSGTTTQRGFVPTSASNYETEAQYWKIFADSNYPNSDPRLTSIAYARLPHGITSNMTDTATYHMQSQIESQGWVDVNTFSVRVSQT